MYVVQRTIGPPRVSPLAVAAYARALALKIDETDVDAIARFRDALAPIDPLRVSGRAGSIEEEAEDDADAGSERAVRVGLGRSDRQPVHHAVRVGGGVEAIEQEGSPAEQRVALRLEVLQVC